MPMTRKLPAILLLLALALPLRADTRAEIEQALKDMSAAVLAADKPTFLKFIATDEPQWLTEETHWADQLEKFRPAEFALTIGEGDAKFQDAVATFPLVMRWRIDTGPKTSWGAGGEARTVAFPPAIFRKQDGRWVWCGTEWETLKGDGFVIRYRPEAERIARDILEAFPVAKAHADSVFGIRNTKPQQIELFTSMDHLKATVYINMPDHYLGGWNESGESIKFMTSYTRGVDNWTWAFAHEYGHVATWELGPEASKLPWWIAEGAAEFSSLGKKPGAAAGHDREVIDRYRKGTLPKFEEIADYVTCEPGLKHLAYSQGYHMVRFITRKGGDAARNQWIAAVCQGRSLDQATQEVFKEDFAALENEWRATLETQSAAAPTPAPGGLVQAGSVQKDEPEKKTEAPKPADDPATRGEVEQLLRKMGTASVAADQQAYLALVSPADPIFLKEQQNWAKDFSRKKPESVEFAFDGDGYLRDGAYIAPLKTSWKMAGGRERSVTFPARFVRGEPGWLYAGEDWKVREADKVRVMYMDDKMEKVAGTIVEIFPAIRDHVHEGFELRDHKPLTERTQQVKLYTSMRHLQESIYLSYTDSLGGWNEPGEAIKLLTSSASGAAGLSIVLAHEYGHVGSFELGPKANDMPWWVLEGIAELSASKYSKDTASVDRMNRRWAAGGGLVDWDKLSDFFGEATQHSANVYKQGEHMMAYITDRFGRTKRNEWMRAMSAGSTIDEASQKALGLSFADLDKDWRKSLEAAAESETATSRDKKPQADQPRPEEPGDHAAPKPPIGDTKKKE
jgi:hypothetical protein